MTSLPAHPRRALFDAGERLSDLPVCDHYAGVESRMRKALALQAERGPVFDVTLDCEDGAPVGGEAEHARLVADLAAGTQNRHDRVGARVHPCSHSSFESDVDILIGGAGTRLAYLMVPKLASLDEARRACAAIRACERATGLARSIPVHGLIETHGGLRDVMAIAALPDIESLSFGLMDFVSDHRGAIPGEAMGAQGQFTHPLIVRAKLEIAAACHASGKTPSHCVVTEFTDLHALSEAARRAARDFGYTRMWSIHPGQIEPILSAFAPDPDEIRVAADILLAARQACWAPVRHRAAGRDTLHDRASYRYYWHVLARAHRTGQDVPSQARAAFFEDATGA